jgi:Ribbon-helix-helix protein, copG family
MRTIIELEDLEAMRLDHWAKQQNISRAEAVRRAVRQMLELSAAAPGTGFGLWAQHAPIPSERDGLALQKELRAEWPE